MARTQSEILAIMTAKAAEYPEMSELESNSSLVAVWSTAKEIIAFLAALSDVGIDDHKAMVEALIVEQEAGGLTWYRDRVLDYQHGDSLQVIENRLSYSAVDDSKKIVAHASVDESLNGNGETQLEIKVAKSIDGTLTVLDAQELAGLSTYLRVIKYAGTIINLQSLPANLVAYDVTVTIDQAVIDSEGKMIDGSTETPIFDAIDIQNNNPDGEVELHVSTVEDVLQGVTGVVRARVTQARYYDGAAWQVFAVSYKSEASYVNLDRGQSNITYV